MFNVNSEVGRLREVIVHRPGRELSRLTPANVDALLFDDVMWAERAREEHDLFAKQLRRPRGRRCTTSPTSWPRRSTSRRRPRVPGRTGWPPMTRFGPMLAGAARRAGAHARRRPSSPTS